MSSAETLNRETDARFWAQTHYKIGQKLDPNDARDKAFVRVWVDILAKVKAEDAAGKLVLTYTNPTVADSLAAGKASQTAAVDHVHAAATAPTPEKQAAHVAAATIAVNGAAQLAANAAAHQPPTVSPAVVHAAATDAAHARGAKAPPAPSMPSRVVHDNAKPSHPDLAMPVVMAPAIAPTTPDLSPAGAPGAPGGTAPPDVVAKNLAADAVADQQAQAAPQVAADVHDAAAAAANTPPTDGPGGLTSKEYQVAGGVALCAATLIALATLRSSGPGGGADARKRVR